jgi:hypothetical protein
MPKDVLYDLHLKTNERREFGVPDPQFKLGSSWLVQTISGVAKTIGALVLTTGATLVDAMDLVRGHFVSKRIILSVGFHSLTCTTLGMVILVKGQCSPSMNIRPVDFD